MKSALFIRGGAIGDFILTLPGIHAFREQFPETRVEIMGYPHIAEIAHRRFYAEAISSLDRSTVAGFFARKGSLDEKLCDYFRSFDLIVSFLYDPDEFFIQNLRKTGAQNIISTEGTPAQSIHAMEHYAQWLSKAKVTGSLRSPKVYPTQEDLVAAQKQIPNLPLHPVLLHPGSGSASKNWPVERYLELALWIMDQGLPVLVLDGPADYEVQKEFWRHPHSKSCIRCQGLSLRSLSALMKACQVMVGNDSGMSHLAAAAGTPVVALFGPTPPEIWGPRGSHVTLIQKGPDVSSIPVEEVKRAVTRYLNLRRQGGE